MATAASRKSVGRSVGRSVGGDSGGGDGAATVATARRRWRLWRQSRRRYRRWRRYRQRRRRPPISQIVHAEATTRAWQLLGSPVSAHMHGAGYRVCHTYICIRVHRDTACEPACCFGMCQCDPACMRAAVRKFSPGVEPASLHACLWHLSVMIAIAPPDKRSHHANVLHGDGYY